MSHKNLTLSGQRKMSHSGTVHTSTYLTNTKCDAIIQGLT